MSYVLFDVLIVFFYLMLYSFRNTVHISNDRCVLFYSEVIQRPTPPPSNPLYMCNLDPTIQPTTIALSLFGRIKVQKGRVWKF